MKWLQQTWKELRQTLTPAGLAQFFKSHRWSLAVSGLVSVLGLVLFIGIISELRGALFRFISDVEARSLDARFIFRGKRPVDPRVVIIGIDQTTVNRLGFPFPRHHYVKMLERVCGDGARSVGLDIFFPFRDSSAPLAVVKRLQAQIQEQGQAVDEAAFKKVEEAATPFDSDTQFAEAMKKCGNVVLGHAFYDDEAQQAGLDPETLREYNYVLGDQAYPQVKKFAGERFRFFIAHPEKPDQFFDAKGVLPNLRMFAEVAKHTGFINAYADTDGTYRRMPLIMRYPEKVKTQLEENFFPSLAVQTTRAYLQAGPDATIFWFNRVGPERVQIAQHTVFTDRSGQVLVNYAGEAGTFPTIPFANVVDGQTQPGFFKDKIVYVGATAIGITSDIRPNTYQKQGYPGVEIHANITDNILSDAFLKRGDSEEMADLVLILLSGAVMGLVFVVMRPSLSWLAFLASAVALLGYVYYQFRFELRWISLVIPGSTLVANFIAVTTYRVIFEEREKRKVRGAFGMYVHPGLIGQMLKDPGLLRLGGEEAELTVMFSDVRGFTSISERLSPTQLVDLLNEYLTEMSDIIMRTWGTVDKYEGDAIMAFWGRPYPQPDHASRACTACLNMIEGLERLNAKWRKEGKQELNIGVGLNTGPMVVGNMGSNKRFNYTVMGDAVNLGSRLEGQNKEYGTRLIISETTYQYVKDEFVCRELDWIRVKGKNKPVAIFELMAFARDRQKWEPLAKVFRQGLQEYRKGNFDGAMEIFEDILSAYPNDGPAKLFRKRCELYVSAPPVGAWDGVYTATSK
jgi:adenylate cyclase